MSAHTPGPWKAQMIDGDVGVTANHMCSFPGMRYDICERVGGDRTKKPTKGTPEANARLIAAAPELLATLQKIHSEKCLSLEAIGEIERIIAKATGGPA